MLNPDELAGMREQVEGGFQDDVTISVETSTDDGEGGSTSNGATTVFIGKGTLQRMKSGAEGLVSDRLQGKEGYTLKVPHTVDPNTAGTVTVNGEAYEIITAHGGEVRATHTRLMLAKLT